MEFRNRISRFRNGIRNGGSEWYCGVKCKILEHVGKSESRKNIGKHRKQKNGVEMNLRDKSGISEWDFGISGRNSEWRFGVILQSGVQNFGAHRKVGKPENIGKWEWGRNSLERMKVEFRNGVSGVWCEFWSGGSKCSHGVGCGISEQTSEFRGRN